MPVLVRRLWIQLTADRKRFTILCTMLAIGLLLWGRIIVTSNMPRTAVADPNGQTGMLPPPVGGTDPSSDKREIRTVRVKLAVLPNRDPLLISNRHFPKPTPIELLPPDGPKFPPNATENLQQAETRLTEELRVLVDKFKLEAVMHGKPMAVINGKTHELYAEIPSVTNPEIRFQLIQVGHRSVILECAGRRFKLKMDYPGNDER